MCHLYRLSKGPAGIAKLFGAGADPPGNAGESVYPGYTGYVVAEGRVRQMTWWRAIRVLTPAWGFQIRG